MNFILNNLAKIGFEWRMGLFNLINFLIIFWILKRFFFKPIAGAINARQEKIKESVDNFQKAKTELQMAEKKAQEIIDNAKVEANKIIEKGYEDAKELAEKLKSKSKAEIEILVKQAKKNIEIDRKEMKAELKKDTAALIIMALEKVIGERLDAKKDEKLILEVIEGLK